MPGTDPLVDPDCFRPLALETGYSAAANEGEPLVPVASTFGLYHQGRFED